MSALTPGGASTNDPHGRVMMALSGGVDSAVGLLLLERQGCEVEALFMKNWEEDDGDGYCAAAEDLADAEQVCAHLGVTLHTVNFSHEYWENVFTRFLDEYANGRTPNPDVLCNREVKFQVFAEHARTLGAEHIATGHYARIAERGGERCLLAGADGDKDQSYFLHMLSQEQLQPALFPIGDLRKGEVRRLAREAGLKTHDKKDSTGICFIGEQPFQQFLARFLTPRPGDIESVDGLRVGRHEGLMFYTIGQRQGLGIGGRAGGSGEPWYVVDKDLSRDTLIVAQGREHPALYASTLIAGDVHWIRARAPALPFRCEAKVRYRQPPQACQVLAHEDGCQVQFDTPQWAAAPGQSVVFYAGDECLGGAIIDSVRR
jgi:tRNA-specific 2-thiouridylase